MLECPFNAIDAVHPHARGEHEIAPPSGSVMAGSSPRTWGTHIFRQCAQAVRRFIPTHVGNTTSSLNWIVSISVHPHARGEHTSVMTPTLTDVGSSPRTWGTPWRRASERPARRFIPTHVGNTMCGALWVCVRTVHPHARGEHGEWRGGSGCYNGSSPRTWGTLPCCKCLTVHHRFIPTHVGNTEKIDEPTRHKSVHPHARGEHCSAHNFLHIHDGSSPRTWGTLQEQRAHRTCSRFIPTHVGNTKSIHSRSSRRAVHPHARGEHSLPPPLRCALRGSSPRTWGTPIKPQASA